MSSYGVTPNAACAAMLTELSRFKFLRGGAASPGGTGCVKTLARYAGARGDLDALDVHLTSGLPAFLVAYLGGPISPCDTNGQVFEQKMSFAVYCCAGRYSDRSDRLSPTNPTVEPGIEDLMDWATYYGARALAEIGLKCAYPTGQSILRWEVERYVAVVDFSATRRINIYDEEVAGHGELKRLGIVHDPVDVEQLFESDNVTPKSEWPSGVDGGVADL